MQRLHRPPGDRCRPLRLLGGGVRAGARHRHPRARSPDGVLARPDARRHVPEVRPRLVAGRCRPGLVRGVLRARGAVSRRRRPDPHRGLPRPHRLVRRAQAPRARPADGHRADQERHVRGHPRGRLDDHRGQGAGGTRHRALRPAAGLVRGRAGRPALAHQRAGRLRRRGREAGRDHRRPPERVRVGRPALRPRGRAGRRRAPARDAEVREGQLEVRRPAGRADPRRARLVAQPAHDPAAGDRAAVLAGRPADPGVVAHAAAAPGGGHQPSGDGGRDRGGGGGRARR